MPVQINIQVELEEKALFLGAALKQEKTLSSFVRDSGRLVAEMDPHSWRTLEKIARVTKLSLSTIVSNIVEDWAARKDAERAVFKEEQVLPEFSQTVDGAVTGEALRELLLPLYKKQFQQQLRREPKRAQKGAAALAN
jgi:hypothetical protein